MRNKANKKAFSLIEILVVISIFAVIGILSTRALFQTLRSARKSDSLVRVRENVNYAMGIIERQVRNAESVNCTSVTPQNLPYISGDGISTFFNCTVGPTGRIASGSAILTSNDVSITACTFTCTSAVNNPPSINVTITAEDNLSTGPEKGSITSQTEILLRNY